MKRLLATLVATALTACTADTQTPSPSPTLVPSAIAIPALRLIGDEPVLEARDLGRYSAILSAVYFEADGLRHAYVVGFAELPGDQRAFHVTSSDGQRWTVDEADPFAGLGLDLNPPGPIPGSVLEAADGTWVMYLWGIPAPSTRAGSIYRATAPDPGGPWTADPQPVLEPGESGAWDDAALDFPAAVRADDGYLMLYGASTTSDRERSAIGLATSPDGVGWQRVAENPVITSDTCGDQVPQAAQPRLVQPEDGPMVVLWAAGRTDVHAATSEDGRTWTCSRGGPILTQLNVPSSQGIHTIAAALVEGELSMLVESLIQQEDGSIGSELWLAEQTSD